MILRLLKYSLLDLNTIIPLIVIVIVSSALHLKRVNKENRLILIANIIFQLAFLYSVIILVLGFESFVMLPEADKLVQITISITRFMRINMLAGILNIVLKTLAQIQIWISKDEME